MAGTINYGILNPQSFNPNAFFDSAAKTNELLQSAVQRKAGQRYAAGDVTGAANTLAESGDIQGAQALKTNEANYQATLDKADTAQKADAAQKILEVATAIDNEVQANGGDYSQAPAYFEQIKPVLTNMGIGPQAISALEPALARDPKGTLAALIDHSKSFIPAASNPSIGQQYPGAVGTKGPNGEPVYPPIGVINPTPRANWRPLTPEEQKAYPGAVQIDDASKQVRYPPAAVTNAQGTGSDIGEVAASDPASGSILAQTGISFPTFLAITGQAARLPRDQATRNAAFKGAENFANKQGIDVSTFASQYQALNTVLQNNIQRVNQTRIMEGELSGTIDNLQPIADAARLGTLRVANVAKLFAGQEFNDPLVEQYALQLGQLREELAGYNAALQGRPGTQINDSDRKAADLIIKNGLSSRAAEGFRTAIQNATSKMTSVMNRNVDLARKGIWDLFGVGENYKPQYPEDRPGDKAAALKAGIPEKEWNAYVLDPNRTPNWRDYPAFAKYKPSASPSVAPGWSVQQVSP